MTREHPARVRARRPLFLGALALLVTTGTFLACGSDDPVPAPPGVDGGGDEASSPDEDASSDAAPIDDGGVTDFDAPGDNADAATRQDAAKIEEGGTCPGLNPCDCDNDGYEAQGECGGTDCDDRDPLRYPNQGYVSEPLEPGSDGNWDCKDPVEKQYVVKLNCATLLGLNCNSKAEGFRDDPPCGTVADYYRCKPGLLACGAEKIGTRRQGCK